MPSHENSKSPITGRPQVISLSSPTIRRSGPSRSSMVGALLAWAIGRGLCWCHRVIIVLVLAALFTACSSDSPSSPILLHQTPTPQMSGGEPVLQHSQIFFQNAPLPTTSDLQFDNNWMLSGHDTSSTRSIDLPSCCGANAPTPLWYRALDTPILYPPAIGNGRVYILASDGYLHVLKVQTGEEQWRIPVGGQLTSNGLALAHGRIYLAIDGHSIAALDANSGQMQWRFETGGVVHAAPIVVGRDLLVASGANTLWCLDALTGEKYWVFHSEDTLAQFWPTGTTPAIADGQVYVALGASNEFNVLDLRTGRKIWEYALHERLTGGPVLDEMRNLVYIVTWSGRTLALNRKTRNLQWDIQLPSGSESAPAFSQRLGMLYVGSFDGNLYALAASNGKIEWQKKVGTARPTSPLIIQAKEQTWLIVSSAGGSCAVIDAGTGRQLYKWNLGELRAAPVVAQDILYQTSLGDQGIFAFKL